MTPLRQVDCVVFDLGGVLFSEGKGVAANRLYERLGYDPDRIVGVLSGDASVALRRGLITTMDFIRQIRRDLPPAYDAEAIVQAWHAGYQINERVAGLVQFARAHGQRTIAFSDTTRERIACLERNYGYRRLFDVELYSYEHGLLKNDAEFNKRMVEVSGVAPGRIASIDDSAEQLAFTRQFGVITILFEPRRIAEVECTVRRLAGIATTQATP